jgi:hypothetical protein
VDRLDHVPREDLQMLNAPSGSADRPDTDDRHGSCADCDPDLLDHIKCQAQGIKAQADYNAAHLDELNAARTKYDDARHAYGEARKTARPAVEDLGKQLGQVLEQLKCLVDNTRKIGLLDEAFAVVRRRLQECHPPMGCYFGDECDFGDHRRCAPEDIASRIADIERRAQWAKTVFTDLIGEPAEIARRVTARQAEVAAIVTGMATDSRTVDFVALYAQALVAQWRLQAIYRGFPHVNAYVDCLCRTLTCQLKGHDAIAHLKGRQAVEQCHQDAETARCERLRTQTADEVMAEYLRLKEDPRRREEAGRDRDDDRGRDRDRDRDRYRDRDRDRDRDDDRGYPGPSSYEED